MDFKFKIDPKKVFKVFSGTSELSPFHPFYCNEKTILRNCSGRLYAHYNGEDIKQTYWSLRKSAIICDTPERPLEITGPEVIPFLDKIFPRQISKLKIDRGMYVTPLTHEGNTFMDGILFRLSEERFWFVQPGVSNLAPILSIFWVIQQAIIFHLHLLCFVKSCRYHIMLRG